MAKLDFPDASYSPWVAPNNVIYTYIGTSPNGYWEANTANAATNLTAVFVERTGSTMTGPLISTSRVDVGGLTVDSNLTPTTGTSVEHFYGSTGGVIQAFDRDNGNLEPLQVRGSTWALALDGAATFAGDVNIGNSSKNAQLAVGGVYNQVGLAVSAGGAGYSNCAEFYNSSNVLAASIGGDGTATFAGSIDLTDSTVDLYSQTTNTNSKTFQLFSDVGGTKVEKAFITAAGAATFAAGSFAIESDGDISTNIRGHGHIELDSSGSFSSPKIKLFSTTGDATFAGSGTFGAYCIAADFDSNHPNDGRFGRLNWAGLRFTDTSGNNVIRLDADGGGTATFAGVGTFSGDLRVQDGGNFRVRTAGNAGQDAILLQNTGAATFTGNVKIGLSSPVALLDVLGQGGAYSGTAAKKYLYSTDGSIRIIGAESSVDVISTDLGNHASSLLLRGGDKGFGFVNNTDNDCLDLKSFTANADAFYIHGSTGVNLSAHTSIASFTKAGNIGIGTSSPNAKIDVLTPGSIRVTHTGTTRYAQMAYDGIYSKGQNMYVWNQTNHSMLFATNNSERMRIDSSGRMMIGCTSGRNNSVTSAHFQIEGTSANAGSMSLIRNGSGNPAYMIIGSSGGSSIGSLTATLGDQYLGQIVFAGSNGSTMRPGAYISARNDQGVAWTTNDCPTRLEFSTTGDGASSPTEKMRLEQSGTLRTYMTGSGGRFHLASDQSAGNTILLNCVHSRSNITTGGTASCRIYTDGDIQNTNNSYAALSDITLKENIFDANSQWEDIKRLRIRKFNFKAETGNSTHTQIGVIAQEVELVSPGLVKVRPALTEEGEDSGETIKTVSSSVLYMKAVKALQEALERIETLETKVAALEAG